MIFLHPYIGYLKRVGFFVLLLVGMAGCNSFPETPVAFYRKSIPAYVTDSIYLDPTHVPTVAKRELGRYLFYDTRLSINSTKACASCHDPAFSFTDTYRRSIGSYGDLTQHNAPPLLNLIFNQYLTAADSSLHYPEQQINNPMLHTHPVELGWKGQEQIMLDRFRKDELYRVLFSRAYPNMAAPVTLLHLQHCITTFIKSIYAFQSPFDKYLFTANQKALTETELRGFYLFQSDQLKCKNCHSGINFNQPTTHEPPYFNTGFFTDTFLHKGLAHFTQHSGDLGKYKVPTLRNLAFTAPYLHDGSAETLEEVIRLYEQGGQPFAVNKHPFITGFKLNSQQRRDLIHFLLSLSDSTVTTNPAYSNPFQVK